MAKITLQNLRHSYYPEPKSDDDFALKRVALDWQDGGAYALLGLQLDKGEFSLRADAFDPKGELQLKKVVYKGQISTASGEKPAV